MLSWSNVCRPSYLNYSRHLHMERSLSQKMRSWCGHLGSMTVTFSCTYGLPGNGCFLDASYYSPSKFFLHNRLRLYLKKGSEVSVDGVWFNISFCIFVLCSLCKQEHGSFCRDVWWRFNGGWLSCSFTGWYHIECFKYGQCLLFLCVCAMFLQKILKWFNQFVVVF